VIREQQHVRVSGWLMLDPEHPDQVSKTRGTIWEIHRLCGSKWSVAANGHARPTGHLAKE